VIPWVEIATGVFDNVSLFVIPSRWYSFDKIFSPEREGIKEFHSDTI
jgi:hypothetical protein